MGKRVKARGWKRLTTRRVVQTAALLLSNAGFFSFLSYIPCGYLQCSNCALSTFACPLILIQRAAVVAGMGMFGSLSAKIMGSVAAAAAILVLFGALLGAWGCGWLCPFGFVQDLLGMLRKHKFRLPKWSGYLRLPFLVILVVLIQYWARTLFFCDICPPGAINRLWQQALGIPLFFKTPQGILALISLVVLGGFLVAAIFVSRPFCTLLCPIGGVEGPLNKISGLYLRVDRDACTHCNRCARVCPQGLDPVATPNHSLCSRCLECTGVCDALHVDIRL